MTLLSVDPIPYFVADDLEIRRAGPTYTVETVEAFPDDELVLILGADAALGIRSWHRWQELHEGNRDPPEVGYQKIIVGADFSDHSIAALAKARKSATRATGSA